jgi:thiol-disulfide isomerase/thioredoxin
MGQSERVNPLDRLVSAGVLSTATDETVVLSDRFNDAREKARSSLDADGDESLDDELARLDLPERVLVDVAVLREFDPTLAVDTAVSVAWSLSMFDESTPTSGVPDGFVPVAGDEIEQFVSGFRASVLYCWREECPPCDLVRADLEALVDDGTVPAWMGRAAVYGPAAAAELSRAYDIGGAPTLLFWVGETIDCRYVGPKDRETMARELRTVAARAEPDG